MTATDKGRQSAGNFDEHFVSALVSVLIVHQAEAVDGDQAGGAGTVTIER